jgi:hypothetical protein
VRAHPELESIEFNPQRTDERRHSICSPDSHNASTTNSSAETCNHARTAQHTHTQHARTHARTHHRTPDMTIGRALIVRDWAYDLYRWHFWGSDWAHGDSLLFILTSAQVRVGLLLPLPSCFLVPRAQALARSSSPHYFLAPCYPPDHTDHVRLRDATRDPAALLLQIHRSLR